jgi:hypothetical protein
MRVMDQAISERLDRIESMLEQLLEHGGVSVDEKPRRQKGDPSKADIALEAERIAEIYKSGGREAMKAAMKERNEKARQRMRSKGRAVSGGRR